MARIPDSGPSGITTNEVLLELERLSKRNDRGMTTREIAKEIGKSLDWVREMIQKAQANHWVERGLRSITRIDGRDTTVAVYTFRRPVVTRARKRAK